MSVPRPTLPRRVRIDARRVAVPGLAVAAASAGEVVRRELRRARTTARLQPPASCIAATIPPPDRTVVAPAPALRLAALGDSSIAGVGVEHVTDTLAVQVGARVAAAVGRTVGVAGLGVSGARTADVTRAQLPQLEDGPPPDVILVVVGANDIVHTTPPWRYASDLGHLCNALERVGAPVVACNLPETRAITIVGHPLRDAATAYGHLLGAVQRRMLRDRADVTLVDARGIAGPAFLERPEAMSGDGFHPSAIGYALLADALAPAVVDALAARAGHGQG